MADVSKFSPDNGITIYDIKDAKGRVEARTLLKDTVGWTGKNFNMGDASHTFVKNAADRTYLFPFSKSVTAGKKYVVSVNVDNISGFTSGDALHIRFLLNDITHDLVIPITASGNVKNIFTAGSTAIAGEDNAAVYMYIPNDQTENATISISDIMFADADEMADPSYEPFHDSVESMYEEEIYGINLLNVTAITRTVGGVTFTVNRNNKNEVVSVVLNGTATTDIIEPIGVFNYVPESVILRGCPSGGAWNKYRLDIRNENNAQYGDYLDTGNGVTFTPNANYTFICIRIANGTTLSNQVFKPIVQKAAVGGSIYRPYNFRAIQNQLNTQGMQGSRNILKPVGHSYTHLGVTYTTNADGSVTLSGQASGGISVFRYGTFTAIKGVSYKIVSGVPDSDATHRLWTTKGDQSSSDAFPLGHRLATGVPECMEQIACATEDCEVIIQVMSGQSVDNITYHPMILYSSDPDENYAQFAMSNRELTEKKLDIAKLKTIAANSADFSAFKTAISNL